MMNKLEFDKRFELISTIKSGTYHVVDSKNLFGLDLGTLVVIKDEKFVITDKFLYEEIKPRAKTKTGYAWEEYTITSLSNPDTVWFLEVELDDKLYISLTKEKFNASMVDVLSNKKVSLRGETYYLDEKSSAICTKFSTGESWEVQMQDFESEDGDLLSVETWEDGNEEAYQYDELKEYDIKILK